MLSWIDFSIQSSTVKTEIMQKIPIVIPRSDRTVLNLLTITELTANKKPSLKSLKNILQFLINIFEKSKIRKPETMPNGAFVLIVNFEFEKMATRTD